MIKRIDSMADFVTGISDFQRNWNQIREDALVGALLHGGFTKGVIERTPKSEGERYRGSAKYGYSNRKDRDRYGHQRLLRSMIHAENEGSKTDFTLLHKRIDSFELAFGPDADWDVPYAAYQHESKVPESKRSHKVWVRKVNKETGRVRNVPRWTSGWSFDDKKTGNKFLEKPWNENEIRTTHHLGRNIEEQLKNRGLL